MNAQHLIGAAQRLNHEALEDVEIYTVTVTEFNGLLLTIVEGSRWVAERFGHRTDVLVAFFGATHVATLSDGEEWFLEEHWRGAIRVPSSAFQCMRQS